VVTTRIARASDADAVAALAAELHAYLDALGDSTPFHFTADTYLRDGFGEDPAFVGVVAEAGGVVVGYALINPGYDTDRSRREAYLNDLVVAEQWRGQSVGRQLMRAAAEAAKSHYRAELLWWGVHDLNAAAFRFYRGLGAREIKGVRFMSVDIDALVGDARPDDPV